MMGGIQRTFINPQAPRPPHIRTHTKYQWPLLSVLYYLHNVHFKFDRPDCVYFRHATPCILFVSYAHTRARTRKTTCMQARARTKNGLVICVHVQCAGALCSACHRCRRCCCSTWSYAGLLFSAICICRFGLEYACRHARADTQTGTPQQLRSVNGLSTCHPKCRSSRACKHTSAWRAHVAALVHTPAHTFCLTHNKRVVLVCCCTLRSPRVLHTFSSLRRRVAWLKR